MLHVSQTPQDFLAATTPYKETSEGSVGYVLFGVWPRRFPFQPPHLHFFPSFFPPPELNHSVLLCIQSRGPQMRARSGVVPIDREL